MQLPRWQAGRQNTGYEILTLINNKFFKCDCHLIRYKVGASIPAHVDKVDDRHKHFRLNVELWPAKRGGELVCAQSLFRWGPINFFRPDEVIHSVTKVEEGVRYVLSIGWKRMRRYM